MDLSPQFYHMTLDTDESYELTTKASSQGVQAIIAARSFFGSRHALETLSQLISTDGYGQSRNQSALHVVASNARIADKPSYPYRGVLLDLSRHYLSVSKIESVIRGMGYNKLNRLHLHLTDTASFPLDMEDLRDMARYGAYGDDMQYDRTVIDHLTKFAKVHGVTIVPGVVYYSILSFQYCISYHLSWYRNRHTLSRERGLAVGGSRGQGRFCHLHDELDGHGSGAPGRPPEYR